MSMMSLKLRTSSFSQYCEWMHESNVRGALHKIGKFMAPGSRVHYGQIVKMNLILGNVSVHAQKENIDWLQGFDIPKVLDLNSKIHDPGVKSWEIWIFEQMYEYKHVIKILFIIFNKS